MTSVQQQKKQMVSGSWDTIGPSPGKIGEGFVNLDHHGQRRFGRVPAARLPGLSDLHRSIMGSRVFGANVQLRAQHTKSDPKTI